MMSAASRKPPSVIVPEPPMKRSFAPLVGILLLVSAVHASNRITEEVDPSQAERNKVLRKAAAADPFKLNAAEVDTLRAALEKDRADTREWLRTSPTSYLAAIARRDFGNQRTLSVGSDPANDVRLPDSTVAARYLRVTVVGDSFRVESADPSVAFAAGGQTLRAATIGPGSITVGRFTVRLSHQRYPAIIVFDPQSKRFADYKGLNWFPPDFSYRYVLPMVPNPDPDTLLILSTHSQARRAIRAGWFVFKVKGKRCVLEATRLLEPGVGEHDVSVFFRDKTTGKESYDVGRYVDPERLPDGRFVLDFNNAYNPACAVSPYYNCPIPPKSNKLGVEIKAGELNAHYAH